MKIETSHAMLFKLTLFLITISCFPLSWGGSEIFREGKNNFPRCIHTQDGNYFFKWKNHELTRTVRYLKSGRDCADWKEVKKTGAKWKDLDPVTQKSFPEDLQNELKQIAEKTRELRNTSSAKEYFERNPLEYTIETNRNLTEKYGHIFSAKVFRAWVESKDDNLLFRNKVLEDLRSEQIEVPDRKITLVVSLGLGWSERYDILTPFYIRDFIADIKSLGFPVVFLQKNPFGSINGNIDRIVPQLRNELEKGNDLILLSLCKGTPEILSALGKILSESPSLNNGQILGLVNLSGMIRGTFFSDIRASSILPKLVQPLLKILPINSARESAEMIRSLKYVKSTIVEKTISEASPHLPRDLVFVNVTGAPMSERVLEGDSPMKPVLKYNFFMKFLKSANDGFIELPSTLIPESVSKNQVTLVLDSSHLLADGYLEEQSISERGTRRKLYQSIVKYILNK